MRQSIRICCFALNKTNRSLSIRIPRWPGRLGIRVIILQVFEKKNKSIQELDSRLTWNSLAFLS